jgi:hypothetical protein
MRRRICRLSGRRRVGDVFRRLVAGRWGAMSATVVEAVITPQEFASDRRR